MDLAKTLAGIAPTLATALGGPLAGIAVKAAVGAFGLNDDATANDLAKAVASATPEQLAALKKIDNDFAVQMRQLDIDLERIKSENVDSARKMQQATRSYMPAVLAVLITVGYFGILLGLLGGMLKLSNNEALLILIGALSTAWGAVVQFFFGSSSGSQAKDAVIASRK